MGTQEERRLSTRTRLLDATVAHLFAALTARYEARFAMVAAAGAATVPAALTRLAGLGRAAHLDGPATGRSRPRQKIQPRRALR